MSSVPRQPKIYHITHISNLSSIVGRGELISDSQRLSEDIDCTLVGMSTIKQRRLEQIGVKCHLDTKVGEYVPFYFCPRSIMLYILHKRNHLEISYTGTQEEIVHLEADLKTVVTWANSLGISWAFSDRNAASHYADFYKDLNKLDQLNWQAIGATAWSDTQIKEGKQAEFLVFQKFPWTLVEKIGTMNNNVSTKVRSVISGSSHQPKISVENSWYY
jgi:hypothetical protein